VFINIINTNKYHK